MTEVLSAETGETVADLIAESRRLVCTCRDCGQTRITPPQGICVSRSLSASQVGTVMRCSQCGGHDIETKPEPERARRKSPLNPPTASAAKD